MLVLAFSISAGTASAQPSGQELIESKKIVADEMTDGILTKTTDVTAGLGIFDHQVTYVYAEDGPHGAGVHEARLSKVQHDADTGEYLIQSNGADVWDNEDQCLYMWTTRPRSYRMSGMFRYIMPGNQEWAKQGIMIRSEPEFEGSPHIFLQWRGNEDRVERGVRPLRSGATTTWNNDQPQHEITVIPGTDSLEPMWLRVTRIWPANQVILEDSNDGKVWELLQFDPYAALLPIPEEANWGVYAFDHMGNVDALPDEALIRNLLLEPVTVGSRFFSETHFEAGQSVDVKITLNNEGDPTTANVKESVPQGWTVKNISDAGALSGTTITWNIAGFKGLKDLSYTVTPSANATRGDFSGEVNGIQTAGNAIVGLMAKNLGAVGAFDGNSTIGSAAAGKVSVSGSTYNISGAGSISSLVGSSGTAEGLEDSGQFVWKRVRGDFSVEVAVTDVFGPDDNTKAGLMVRDSLSPFSSWMMILIRNNLNVRTESRDLSGHNPYSHYGTVWYSGNSVRNVAEVSPSVNADEAGNSGGMRIRREKGIVYLEFIDTNNPNVWTTYCGGNFMATDPVYVGLAVASNADPDLADAVFTNVKVVGQDVAVDDWVLH